MATDREPAQHSVTAGTLGSRGRLPRDGVLRFAPLLVFAGGLAAALAVHDVAGRSRRAELARSDARVVSQVAASVASRAQSLAQAVRGPALAFDLQALEGREVSGVLRLAYSQNDAVTAVTLLDRAGVAVVPAAFLARGGGGAGGRGHPAESFDDLDRFAREIPIAAVIARGRVIRGPYSAAQGGAPRALVAEPISIAQGTSTMVLATEFDPAALLDGAVPGPLDGEVVLVAPGGQVGAVARLPEGARRALESAARAPGSFTGGRVLAGVDWRVAVAPAPAGLDGVVAVAWQGDDARERRARNGDVALAVIVASVMGAVAAALAVAMRDPGGAKRAGRKNAGDPGADVTHAAESRVLGAVVKELANPIAAAAAAARVLAGEPGQGRVAEAVQRSVLRAERAFRRVARLARAGEERTRSRVDLAALTVRESESLRAEIERTGLTLVVQGDPAGTAMVDADPEDAALLVQVLIDAARSVAPPRSEIALSVRAEREGRRAGVTVRDSGRVRAGERMALSRLGDATGYDGAASGLAWALAARIASDHGAAFNAQDVEGGVEVSVTFAAR